ncbi:MAG: creatininase [Rariglobus sp.]|jgi:creatinine amidohydrolase|nr:creatininase [Rariglobus sp.]
MKSRAHYLSSMSRAQITALPDKASAPVLVTTGAIEQHGAHLPLAVDALMGQVWITRILEALPGDVSCYVAPPITIGKSNEHVGFPGTLTISKETLRLQLHAIARQLSAWGFRQLAVLNTHGGNTSVLVYTLREIEGAYGMRVTLLKHGVTLNPALPTQEATYGFHAGELETSWLLAVAPQWVRMESAVCEYPARLEDAGELRPEAAPATFAWASQDVSASGVMGDATAGTAEKGGRWIEQIAAGYAARIVELANGGRRRIS